MSASPSERNVFALRVGPDVGFGPMQDRMNAQVSARRRRGVELVPEFRRLVAHVPSAFQPARREHALFRPRRLLVAADAGDQAVEAVFCKRKLQAFGLARGRSRRRRQRRIDRVDRRAGLDLQVELPCLAVMVAERVHLRKLPTGIDMHRGERDPAEKRLARQPDHHVGILSQRPQQRQLLQPRERLAEDVDALRLQRVEVVHRGHFCPDWRHGSCLVQHRLGQPVGGGIVVEKMHLAALAWRGENSIVAVR
jgi:hypothetical protein